MKRLYRLLLILCLSLLGSGAYTCRAQFVVSDPLHMGATFGQVAQDLSFDVLKWQDIYDKIRELEELNNLLNLGRTAYSSVNDILKISKRITRTGIKLENYVKYLMSLDDDSFRIDRADFTYRQFMRKTKNLYHEVEKTIASLKGFLDNATPLEFLSTMDNITQQLSDNVAVMEEQALSEVAELCYEMSISEIRDANNAFKTLVIN